MSVHEHKTTPRQQQFLSKVAERVVRIAQDRDEFAPIGVFDRVRLMGIPQLALQRAVHDKGEQAGITLQSYRKFLDARESAVFPEGPLLVRVLERGEEPVLEPLAERQVLGAYAFAIDVYPPVD